MGRNYISIKKEAENISTPSIAPLGAEAIFEEKLSHNQLSISGTRRAENMSELLGSTSFKPLEHRCLNTRRMYSNRKVIV